MKIIFTNVVWPLALALVIGVAVLTPEPAVSAFGGNCTRITGPVPAGYAAAYNVFSEANELLVRASCGERSFRPLVGSILTSSQNFAVYGTGYYYDGSRWQEYRLRPADGVERSGAWILGDAFGDELPYTSEATFFVAYSCQWASGAWQCGCTDGSCRETGWQLQAVASVAGAASNPPDPETIIGFGE